MEEFQHPDSIWTWSSSVRRGRASVWIPYLQAIEKTKAGWSVRYNGGEMMLDVKKTDSVLIYGASGSLPVAFLDDLASNHVPLLVHRRNLPDPYIFVPGARRDDADILSMQVRARDNKSKCAYVARTLIRERFAATRYPIPAGVFKELAQCRSVDDTRQIEAEQSRIYWTKYYRDAGMDEDTRRGTNPLSAALDAGSFFLYGVLLRWVLMHKMSPAHGFLHVTTGYPSLVYDLMEPYRAVIEKAAFDALADGAKDTTAAALQNLKDLLDEKVYVPSHRATARRKNLLHGSVLALRSWLIGESARLVLPVEGARIGGRRPKQGYKLPGADQK